MALKFDYVVRETGRNLRRNLTLTVASVLTVAVSLSLLGVALLLQKGVANATDRWEDGVEFIIFLQPDISSAQQDRVQELLDDQRPLRVDRWRFVSQEEAYEEFRSDLFPNQPEITDLVEPEILPPSFRVVPTELDADQVEVLAASFEDEPGVKKVIRATEEIQKLEQATDFVRWIVLFAGAVLLGTGLLLILNTIRMAMFARRREIEVMKLVGATNWFILVPFMLEGTIAGIIGAMLGTGAVYGANRGFERWLANDEVLAILQSFAVDRSEVWGIGLLLLILGAAVGAIGSAIAAYRFLDV
ncbi:MAG: cell division protein FtsX [Acidimicrobiales bacterium]